MAKIRYNKTQFSNGMIGKSAYGRTESDYYKASVKKITDGIIYPQGGIKNVTLDETIGIQTNQYERLYEIKKGKFFSGISEDRIYLIGQRKFSDTLDLLRVELDPMTRDLNAVTVVDTMDIGIDFKEYLVQTDDKVIVSSSGVSPTRSETYFSDELQKYADSDDVGIVLEDSATFDINVLTDKEVSGFSLAEVVGAESVTLNSTTINAIGDYTLNVTAKVCEPINEKRRNFSFSQTFDPLDTIPNQLDYVQKVDDEIWVGTFNKTQQKNGFEDAVLLDNEADEPVFEETNEYKIYSQAYQRNGIQVGGTIGLVTKYKVYRAEKIIIATYEGVAITAQGRVAVNVVGTIQNPVTTFMYPMPVLQIESTGGDLQFVGLPSQLSDLMTFSPVNPNFKFIDLLLDDLGYVGDRYYAWKYDPINDYYELYITSDSGHTTEIEIGGIPITQRDEMKETRLYNGSGRKVDGNNKQYQIIGIPNVNTFNAYATTPEAEIEDILPSSLYCYSLLDVDNAKLCGKFDSRLILTQFDEGNSILAFSRLRSPFDFTFDGTTINDAFISEFKDDLDLKIERIIEHKSLVLFTNRGIYASSLLDSSFNPSSFSFKKVHTMIPQTNFPPEFLNGDMIFLDSTGSKLFAMTELKESSRYSVADLTLFANDIFTSGVTVTTIDLAQQVGSEFVLVSSFGADGLVNYNSDSNILSWTTLNTKGIYVKTFQFGKEIYVYDLYSHSLTITKPKASKMVIELLEPEIEFQNGDKLSFYEYYKIERAFIKIFGLFDKLQINETSPMSYESLPYKTDNNYLVKMEMEFSNEVNQIVITAESDTDLILQSVSLIIDIGN